MIYSDIIQSAMDGFYDNDMEFPRNISFPIPIIKDGKIYDLFFVTQSTSDSHNPIDLSILYIQNASDTKEVFIYDKSQDIENFISKKTSIDIPIFNESVSISFPILYERVRQYAFDNNITDEQKKDAIHLAAFYEHQLERNYNELYYRLSPSFFSWVKSL